MEDTPDIAAVAAATNTATTTSDGNQQDQSNFQFRQGPWIDNDEHSLQRLHSPPYDNKHSTFHNNGSEQTTNSKIFHKRSHSDTATLIDPDNNSENESILRRPASRDETSTGQTTAVTFAETSTAGVGNFDGTLARRRHSASGGSSSTTYSAVAAAAAPAPAPLNPVSARGRVYRSSIASDKLTTRDIAALDFLLGIPLEAEEAIVHRGWMLHRQRKLQSKQAGVDDGSDEDEFQAKRDDGVLLEPPTMGMSVSSLPPASFRGRWWEKWIPGEAVRKNQYAEHSLQRQHHRDDDVELELPTAVANGHTSDPSNSALLLQGTPTTDTTQTQSTATANATVKNSKSKSHGSVAVPAPVYAPGRRLEGDEAISVQIPLKVDTVTRQKSIALQAAIREWEIQVAHGLRQTSSVPAQQPLLDGRLFFSAASSYPVGVFSLKRYEPKREEAARRRQKLEARGGGGSHFVMPSRDWRGISYRALLPRKAEQERNQRAFNRFLRDSKINPTSSFKKRQSTQKDDDSSDDDNYPMDDNDDDSSTVSNSSDEDSYIPGILDDPEMTLGRHRNVMIGDCVIGSIVTSTIQFVKPALLKADLNQKFRERFDGWEPNKSQRKYIGARVVDGVYALIDPTDEAESGNQGSESSTQPAVIRMPPSLTLSKIRSLKRQALLAFVKADLEVGTVALACVYFERLCLSCRVDKTNRRLCFASCLLLASKTNEPNEVLVMKEEHGSANDSDSEDNATNARKKIKRLQSSIRPSKRSSSMFASLLEFFTQDWELSLKHLFAAEWGVFAALRFSLHATPSQVAFHFKRLMKTLEWDPCHYLGIEMYTQWGDALAAEERRRVERGRRRERRRLRKERRIQRELEEVMRSKEVVENELLRKRSTGKPLVSQAPQPPPTEHESEADNAVKTSDDDNKKLPSRTSSARFTARAVKQQDQSNDSSQQSERALLGRQRVARSLSLKNYSSSPQKERQTGNNYTSPGSKKSGRPMKLLPRFMQHRRPASEVKLDELAGAESDQESPTKGNVTAGLPLSPSMPMIAQLETFLVPTGDPPGPDHIAINMPPDDQMDLSDGEEHEDAHGDDNNSVTAGSDAGIVI